MKRKILSLILVFAMTVSLLTVGTGAVEPTYGDTAAHWAESSIERWSGHGIIQGSNGLFDPNGQLTCAQLATILAKLLKLPVAKDAGFTDNTADAWYYDAINRCAAAGILNGNGDGTVTPEAPITRERAMVMLARALGIEPIRKPDLTKYTDAAQVSAYAQGYVAALIEAGIVGGVTADELAPQDNINRASTVTILDRAISTYADEAGATVKADGKGIVLVVAENVKITGAPEGTKIVVADGATGLTVNGKSVSDDQTYIVPKTEPAKPSSGSSSGGSYTPPHSHSYVYSTNWDTLVSTKKCSNNDSTETIEGIYYIANDVELGMFRDWVNGTNEKTATDFEGKTIKLTADIDLNNAAWTPIGTSTNPFKGVFDGNGKTISNYSITAMDDNGSGLFGVIDGDANSNFMQLSDVVSEDGTFSTTNISENKYTCVVKNLNVSNAAVTADGKKYVSPVIGAASNAYIANINVTGTTMTVWKYGAGIVAKLNKGVVNNCTAAATFTGSGEGYGGHIAGIIAEVGENAPFVVMKCTNSANITASYGHNGGICALVPGDSAVIVNCTNNGTISVNNAHNAAGIAGQALNGYFINCTNNGAISGSVRAGETNGFGGIVSYGPYNGMFYNCRNTGNITATSATYVAGICGKASIDAQFNNCSNTGTLVWTGDGSTYAYPITDGVIGTEEATTMTFAELKDAVEKTSKEKVIIKNVTVSDSLGTLTLPTSCKKIEAVNAICSEMNLTNSQSVVSINVPGNYDLTYCPNIQIVVNNTHDAQVTVKSTTNGGIFRVTGSNTKLIVSENCVIARVWFEGTGTYELVNNGTIKSSGGHVISTESACSLTFTNNGTIDTDSSNYYAMLFYGNSTVVIHQKGRVNAKDGCVIVAYNTDTQRANSAIYNIYGENGQLTKSWQIATNPWRELPSSSEEP